MSQQKWAKSVRDLFKPFSVYAPSAAYTACLLPDAKVEMIISNAWWELLVVGTLGWELQMPLKPSFFYQFVFLYSFMVYLTTVLVIGCIPSSVRIIHSFISIEP